MKYVLTYIAHADELNQSTITFITNLIKDKIPNIKLTTTKTLSKRSHDQYFTSEDIVNKETINKITEGIEDGVDVVLQKDDEYRRGKKLFVFDMDSTLIYQEVIELIAAYANVEEKVREITNRAMNNELDFKESLRERVKLLRGLEIDQLYEEIKLKLQITNGVECLCNFLKSKGVYLAVVSGGFVPFAEFIKGKLNLDFARANVLEVDDEGRLTGFTKGNIVDGECKAQTVKELCDQLSIDIKASCMVGDGGNDLPAMKTAGFGIAWNAKPRVQLEAPSKLNTKSLRDVLYIMGYTDEELSITI